MEDESIIHRISTLVDEEKAILRDEGEAGPTAEQHERLEAIQQTLDQCWDLLRQRRALREYGGDPEGARVRDVSTVETCRQ